MKHANLILKLIPVAQLPAQTAVIHCKAQQHPQSTEALGNNGADQEAKLPASQPFPATQALSLPSLSEQTPAKSFITKS